MEELRENHENRVYTNGTLIKIGEMYYETIMLMDDFTVEQFSNESNNNNQDTPKYSNKPQLEEGIAYLIEPYYYFYKGKISDYKDKDSLEIGVYYDDDNEIVVVKPETDEEKELHKYSDKITRHDVEEIRDAICNQSVVIFITPDSSHSMIPDESPDDDILKKVIKRALKNKGIDLDQHEVRFASKNMLFNTKQVLRGPTKLSMMLFDRCAGALNLKYTIIVEEAGGETIGYPLKDKIVISSHDTYDINYG